MEGDKENTYFTNSLGLKIFCKYWKPTEEPKAALFICHGVGEHCQVPGYDKMATELTKKGIFVFIHDHVGHGLSEGDRVHVDDGNTYVKDVLQHVNIVKEKYPTIPYLIFGHSMGGLITLKTVLDNPNLFTAMILIGPLVEVNPAEMSPFMVCLAKSFGRFFPQLQVKSIDSKELTHDEEAVKRYDEDPLVWHGGLKVKWSLCMLVNLLPEVNERLSEIEIPFLVIHGTADSLCMASGSQKLYDTAKSQNKTIRLIEGAYHQVHTETEGRGEQCIKEIAEWSSSVLTQGGGQPSS
jgi:acylglycerol lipase